jgi:hypothetical protein
MIANQLIRSRTCTEQSRSSICFVESISILLFIAIALPILTPNLTNAKELNIGTVNMDRIQGKEVPTDYACTINKPNGRELMAIVYPGAKSAWVNLNGKHIRMKETSFQTIKPNQRSIAKYSGENLTVIVESQFLRQNKSDTLSSKDYSYKVTFKNGSNSKTIKTKGYCTG